jgi:glutamine amidotransferase
MIVIIDYDVGNVSAIANMLSRLGFNSSITKNPKDIEKANRIILPGNGSYDTCLKNIRSTNLMPLLERKVLKEGTPLLGICVGAQMLGNSSEEGIERGFGWIDMVVEKFPITLNHPVPNMGWRRVNSSISLHYMIRDLNQDSRFYFVHSYFMKPKFDKNILLTSEYGFEFAAGVINKNIIGVQFHPEKSHFYGKKLLTAFALGEI